MKYLYDTCVFIERIVTPQTLYEVIDHCKKAVDELQITNIVLDEMKPGSMVGEGESKKSKILENSLVTCDKQKAITIIDIEKNEKYRKNFETIRSRYYEHLSDKEFLKELVDSGKYTKAQAKRLYLKDYGECSCIAVAMEEPDKFTIISEDGGKVCEKPEVNIFKCYERSHKVIVWGFDTWIYNTRYYRKRKLKNRN